MSNPLPNVVWVFLDQCRADVLGCYGHPFICTPNIDRLADRGVLFEQAYCNNPVCVPSCASILSGRYSHENGVYDNGGRMDARDSHLLRVFCTAGYRTANVGKVHVGLKPSEMGFDEHREIVHDGVPHFHLPDDYPADWPWRAFDVPGYPQPIIYATDTCTHERTYCAVGVDEAIDIWDNAATGPSPLFLRLSLDRPHTPVSSPKPYDTMYADQTELPNFSERERREQIATLRHYIRNRHWDQFTPDELLKIRSYYYGLVTHLDHELGRLLDAIDRSDQRSNTLIVFSADHGCMLGEHGLQVKTPHYYVETARVPLIFSWPGRLPTGRRLTTLTEMVDLLPTLCDLCGLATPVQASGRSLVPVMEGRDPGKDPGKEVVFAEQFPPSHPHRWLALRSATYAYTFYPNAGEEMLFDLTRDPAETTNLALGGAYDGFTQRLRAEVRQWGSEQSDRDRTRLVDDS